MIKFTLNTSSRDAEIKRRIAKSEKTRDLMRAIEGDLKRSTERNFESQGREPRWKRLKAKTIMAKAKQGRSNKILQGRGDLMNSITSGYNKTSAFAGTNLEYARIHQKGGMTGRNHATRIPARPYLKLTRQENRNIDERVRKFFA